MPIPPTSEGQRLRALAELVAAKGNKTVQQRAAMMSSEAATAIPMPRLELLAIMARSGVWAPAALELVTTGTYDLVGRARPSYDDCLKGPSFDPLCYSGNTASFWSGHSALAFTAAGLSCAHHVYLHIYGDPTADALGCAGMITLASATGTLRVLGDRQYATDVLTGALVGFGFGYGVPTLFHDAAGPIDSMAVTPSSAGLGLALSGTF